MAADFTFRLGRHSLGTFQAFHLCSYLQLLRGRTHCFFQRCYSAELWLSPMAVWVIVAFLLSPTSPFWPLTPDINEAFYFAARWIFFLFRLPGEMVVKQFVKYKFKVTSIRFLSHSVALSSLELVSLTYSWLTNICVWKGLGHLDIGINVGISTMPYTATSLGISTDAYISIGYRWCFQILVYHRYWYWHWH